MGDDGRSIGEECQTQKQSWMAGQVRMEELLAKAVTIATFRDKTFVRGRIVAGARQIFRQCHNLCQQNGPSWSELSSSGGVEAQVFLATS